jgi:hypothetical protein
MLGGEGTDDEVIAGLKEYTLDVECEAREM